MKTLILIESQYELDLLINAFNKKGWKNILGKNFLFEYEDNHPYYYFVTLGDGYGEMITSLKNIHENGFTLISFNKALQQLNNEN